MSICSKEGCSNAISDNEWCGCCKEVGYCSQEHREGDWKNHIEECAYQLRVDPFETAFAAAEEVSQSMGNDEEKWEPIASSHAFVHENGIIGSEISNEQLFKHYQSNLIADEAVGGFQGKKVILNSSNQVPKGTKIKDGRARIYLNAYSGGQVVANINSSVDMKTASVGGGKGNGITVFVDNDTLLNRMARETGNDLRAFFGNGNIVVGLEYEGKRWQVYGSFVLELRKRILGKAADKARILGVDRGGVQVSVTFLRSALLSKKADLNSFTIHSLAIHIPSGNLGSDEPFLPASHQEAAFNPSTADKKKKKIKGAILPGMEDDVAPRIAPVDIEDIEDMLALADVLQDRIEDHKHELNVLQMENVDTELLEEAREDIIEMSRIANVIGSHIELLNEEEEGKRAPANISAAVIADISKAQQLIALTLEDRKNRFVQKRRFRKDLKTMEPDRLKAMFLGDIATLEQLRASGSVGTSVLANIIAAYNRMITGDERYRALLSDPEVKEGIQKMNKLKATDRTAFRNKKRLARQERKVLAKEGKEDRASRLTDQGTVGA